MKEQLEVAILNNIGSNLQFIKNQQWRVSYFTLLAYGAIVATQKYFNFENGYVKLGFVTLTLLIGMASIYLNRNLDESLNKHRDYVTKIYEGNKDQVESYGIPVDQSSEKDLTNLMLLYVTHIGCGLTLILIVSGKTY